MADNYLEKKMEALQERKAKEARARQVAWKKRMDAYRKRLEAEAAAGVPAGASAASSGDSSRADAGAGADKAAE